MISISFITRKAIGKEGIRMHNTNVSGCHHRDAENIYHQEKKKEKKKIITSCGSGQDTGEASLRQQILNSCIIRVISILDYGRGN